MNKIFHIAFAGLILSFSALSTTYVIEKVNKGTHFLKPGQESAGFVNNNEICGAKSGGMMGGEACAVVTPVAGEHHQQLYYLEENVLVTGTPASNLVGFIEGSIVKGTGVGGDKGTGVFKKN